MSSDNKIQSGERLSFSKLFSQKAFKIEIPIIQRDYAQGRNSSSEVRVMFLDALYDYLEENKPNRDLDFVYGSIRQSKEETCFIPLDGQQRLTTLFLLHWYLANISGSLPELRKFLATVDRDKVKSNFTYETRTSSREFCDELISNTIDFENLLPSDDGKTNSLSKTIQDCGWYYLSWENDPTIQSMLTMLDAIHLKFNDKPEFYGRLVDVENPIITFLFLNLQEFRLTDDLYIKMNARGKPLTTFENFKAKFEQHIGKLDWSKADDRKLLFDEAEKFLPPKEYFAHKIDTVWANLFWNYRNVNGKDNSYDDELMNFIRVIMANEYAITSKEKDSDQEYLMGTFVGRKRKDYTDKLTYHIYNRFGILTNSAVNYLIDAMDVLSNGDHKIHTHLTDKFYFDEEQCFKNALKHELTLPQRVQFHAYLKFLIHNKDNKDGFDQWMRVIHNLSENTVIDGADEVARAIKSIEKLIPYSNNFLEYLKDSENQVDFFLSRQLQEEQIKAHLITKSQDWKDVIVKIEKHSYFKGQVLFVFEFAKILKYFEENNNCGWEVEKEEKYFNRFVKYASGAEAVFSAILKSSADLDYLWERAVLSKGDYLIHASAWRRNLLSTTKKMRDFSWKRLLRLPPAGTKEPEAGAWKVRRKYIKKVFDDELFDSSNLKESLVEICKNLPNDWRQYFIANPEFFRYCEQGFIRFEDETKILLFKHSQQNHYHREMYSYELVLNDLSTDNYYKPFTNSWHHEIRSSEEYSCAKIDGWTYKKKRFGIDVHYDNHDLDFLKYPYEIRLYKKVNNEKEKYPQAVIDLMEAMDYEWKPEFKGYWKSKKSKSKALDEIQNLCNKLNNL